MKARVWLTLIAVWGLVACAPTRGPDSPARELLLEDQAFARMSTERGAAAAFGEYLAADAIQLPERGDAIVGRAAITENLMPLADYVLDWTPVGAEASDDASLGYTWGRYRLHPKTDPDAVQVGKYLTVWRRSEDGRWRVVADIGNHEPLAPD
jgi:ketosteroid isomerase-like protein